MTVCPVCAYRGGSIFAVLQGRDFRRCSACGCMYQSDLMPPSSDGETYTADYIRQRGHDHADTPLAAAKRATARYYLSMLARYGSQGNLLEVGCSTGLALGVAKALGWNVYGVEINEAAVVLAQQALGKETVLAGELQDAMFPDDFFTAAMFLDVIEHIPQPDSFMTLVTKKMQKGGTVLAVTPNAASLSAALLRSRWPHLMLEHLVIYSPRGLRGLLSRHGLEVVKTGWAVKFATTETIYRHLRCHPHVFGAAPAARLLRLVDFLDRILLPVNMGEMYVLARKR